MGDATLINHNLPFYDKYSDRIEIPFENPEGSCWIWTGQINNWGYGLASVYGQKTAVHRMVYEDYVGIIPDEYVVDHICRVHACVNYRHLQAITRGENIALGRLRKDTCPQGHTYDDAIIRSNGYRVCRTCNRIRCREADLRRKGKNLT